MKQKVLGFVVSLVALIALSSAVQASVINTISISDLPVPSGIEAFNVWYDVSPDFNLISATVGGTGIPAAISLGWQKDGASVADDIFKFAGSNMDGWALGNQNNLKNGTIATFEFDGTINGINFYQFGDIDGREVPGIFVASWDQMSTNFSAVPIPPSVLLLGGGLLGLLGFRRRFVKKDA